MDIGAIFITDRVFTCRTFGITGQRCVHGCVSDMLLCDLSSLVPRTISSTADFTLCEMIYSLAMQ